MYLSVFGTLTYYDDDESVVVKGKCLAAAGADGLEMLCYVPWPVTDPVVSYYVLS